MKCFLLRGRIRYMRGLCWVLALPLLAQVEEAHRPLFQRPEDKGKAASKLTSEAAAARPAARLGNSPVIRRNFIDERVFARMERDRIPHARLASDEEFARRAWLDATGLIPPYDELVRFLDDRDPN